MNNELLKSLAEKLGVTVEHVWGVLIHQASIDGVDCLVWASVWLVLFCLACFLFIKELRHNKAKPYNEFPLLAACIGIVAVVFVVFFALCVQQAVTDFLNPEYFAIQEISKYIGK